jgi:type I restriction enzyme M protein
MLDQETKRKIDNARDILVGKVPDPKSQVEQITIALIYKFMDDMDKESEGWGGKASFFTGKYKKYAWSNIFDPRLGGFDLIGLYGDAIVEMNHNPNIPQLFRDIFKNAYLPYRDPETLKSFLKEINEFNYDHSEQLGDAFEYLLSVMDSQGDAGQFRTPRHIIDFIVEIVDPKKNDTVVDPACGTAGFLISSYKHILKANTKKQYGDKLTPDEKKRLMNNFMGYDISPDMVRLSLVNMYLHGFSDPKIMEYDTLTSEERWDETSDVMLANPPFMTPKGGIRPHKRFSIQAKRSEVLFVDYIAEHLNPNGRAGVIVPEGIIFQSQKAYKNLRKMLVEDYLWAVVSLPAGVFQPYSGVKTSILLMDKSLVKRTGKLLFVKIENDGFDLGAQRRPIKKNDLPQALDFIKGYKKAVIEGKEAVQEMDFAHVVEKIKIEESGDWNLSGERYREQVLLSTKYEVLELNEIIKTITPPIKIQKKDFKVSGKYPIIDQSKKDIAGWTEDENALITPLKPLVIFGDHTCAIKLINKPFAQGADGIKILSTVDRLLPEYLYFYLKANPLESDGYKRHFKKLKQIKLPLPPLTIQQEIVSEIDGYQKIIDGARQVVDNYKPTIKIDPDWERVALRELTTINNGYVLTKFDDTKTIACIKVGDMNLPENQREITTSSHWLENTTKKLLEINSVIFPKRGAAIATNKKRITKIPCLIDNNCMGLTVGAERLNPIYLFTFLLGFDLSTISNSAGIALINNGDIQGVEIPLPPIETQKEIVAQIEAEQERVNRTKELIDIFERKIKDKISEVWGK